MTTITLRPAATLRHENITNVGGASSYFAAIADDDDATYLTCAADTSFGKIAFETASLPAGTIVQSVALRLRARRPAAPGEISTSLNGKAPAVFTPHTGSFRTDSQAPQSGFTANNLAAGIWFAFDGKGTDVDIAEAYLDVVYFAPPTVAVTAPTDPVDVTQPPINWDFTGSFTQARFQAKIFTQDQFDAAGFDPEASPAFWDSQVQASAADTVTPLTVNLTNGLTYRFYVKGAQLVGSTLQWSDWEFIEATVDVSAPDAPTITVEPDDALARIKITVDDVGGTLPVGSPTVTDVSPPSGDPAGGDTVTVTGTNFDSTHTATLVEFGSNALGWTAATDLVLVDDTTLTCTSPAHPEGGTVHVRVTNDVGPSALTSVDRFSYGAGPPADGFGFPWFVTYGAGTPTEADIDEIVALGASGIRFGCRWDTGDPRHTGRLSDNAGNPDPTAIANTDAVVAYCNSSTLLDGVVPAAGFTAADGLAVDMQVAISATFAGQLYNESGADDFGPVNVPLRYAEFCADVVDHYLPSRGNGKIWSCEPGNEPNHIKASNPALDGGVLASRAAWLAAGQPAIGYKAKSYLKLQAHFYRLAKAANPDVILLHAGLGGHKDSTSDVSSWEFTADCYQTNIPAVEDYDGIHVKAALDGSLVATGNSPTFSDYFDWPSLHPYEYYDTVTVDKQKYLESLPGGTGGRGWAEMFYKIMPLYAAAGDAAKPIFVGEIGFPNPHAKAGGGTWTSTDAADWLLDLANNALADLPAGSVVSIFCLVDDPNNGADGGDVRLFGLIQEDRTRKQPYWDRYHDIATGLITPSAPGAFAFASVFALGGPTWDHVLVQRTNDSGLTWTPVRFANRAETSGATFVVYDYEACNGQPVRYRAQAITATDGGDIASDFSAVSGPVQWASDKTWLKAPLAPAVNAVVQINGIPELKRRSPQGTFDVPGRSDPVVVSDQRKLSEGTVTFTVVDDVANAQLRALLDLSEILLLQTPPGDGWGCRYIAVGDDTEQRPSRLADQQARYVVCPFVEVLAPAVEQGGSGSGSVGSGTIATYQDLLNAFATYNDVIVAFPTYAAILGQ